MIDAYLIPVMREIFFFLPHESILNINYLIQDLNQ